MPDNVPTFFFSHSRQDSERWGNYLRRFFDDLQKEVAAATGVDLRSNRIGMIDLQIRQGDDWDRVLSGPLGTDKVFIAILSPPYFERDFCGKELFAFVQRSRRLGIDTNGALINVENVLPIRWYQANYYIANGKKDERIPPILRRLNYAPFDDFSDPGQTRAIDRYREQGMEQCVRPGTQYYRRLLSLFALRIRDLADLPSADDISFTNLHDAFNYDWEAHFASAGGPVDDDPPPALPAARIGPRALASIVAFYVTNRPFTPEPATVDYADQLIAEPPAGASAGADLKLAALLADVRAAGVAEGFTVFHAAANPVVPDNSRPLLDLLASLSKSDVLTALVVEPSVWPGTVANPQAVAVGDIIRSHEWTGPVLLPSFDTAASDLDGLPTAHGLSRRIVALRQESEVRVAELRRTFVDERGRILRTSSTGLVPDAEPPPGLKGVSPEGE